MKITKNCSRCKREDAVTVDADGMFKEAAHEKGVADIAKRITEFFATIPPEDQPDVVVFAKHRPEKQLIILDHTCIQDGEGHVCRTRTMILIDEIDVLPERKPRVKKEKPASEKKDETAKPVPADKKDETPKHGHKK